MEDVHAEYYQDFPRTLVCLISICTWPQEVCRCQVTFSFLCSTELRAVLCRTYLVETHLYIVYPFFGNFWSYLLLIILGESQISQLIRLFRAFPFHVLGSNHHSNLRFLLSKLSLFPFFQYSVYCTALRWQRCRISGSRCLPFDGSLHLKLQCEESKNHN